MSAYSRQAGTNSGENLRKRISTCFDTSDGIFAGHKNEEMHAREFRDFVHHNHIATSEVTRAASDFLRGNNYPDSHITRQIDKIEQYFNSRGQGEGSRARMERNNEAETENGDYNNDYRYYPRNYE